MTGPLEQALASLELSKQAFDMSRVDPSVTTIEDLSMLARDLRSLASLVASVQGRVGTLVQNGPTDSQREMLDQLRTKVGDLQGSISSFNQFAVHSLTSHGWNKAADSQ